MARVLDPGVCRNGRGRPRLRSEGIIRRSGGADNCDLCRSGNHLSSIRSIFRQTGATSTWLWTELNKMGLPVICIDARHAKAALRMQINKSDRNDAVAIARIMQCGWYKEVRVKDLDSHAIKALLLTRALPVKPKPDLQNHIHHLLNNPRLALP